MSERVRTFLAVVTLTAVIWVWADLEQRREDKQEVPVEVTAPSGYVVRGFAPKHIEVTFIGPKGEIDQLRAKPEDMVCRIALTGPQLQTGRVVVPAKEGFTHWHRLDILKIADNDNTITDGEIVVNLDRRVPQRVPVRVDVKGATLASQPAVEPAEVTATVSESELANLPEAKRFASALLVVAPAPKELKIEREVSLEPRLGGADGIEATFQPAAVRITAQLESTVSTKTIEQISILIAGPPEMLNPYEVVFQEDADRLIDLKVQGPRQLVEPLTAQDVRVELVLAPDDRPTSEGTWIPRPPKILGLPAGVEVVGPLPTINFNLKKRQDEVPAP